MITEIWDIIAASIHGEVLSASERMELARWLESDDRHKRIYERLKTVYGEQVSFGKTGKVDADQAFRKNLVMLKRRKRNVWWSRNAVRMGYAALFVVVSAIAVFLYYQMNVTGHMVEVAANESITAGSSKAVLILSSGERVILEQRDSLTIRESESMINNRGHVLTYSVSEPVSRPKLDSNVLNIPRGGEYRLVLEDGTMVWLNSESRLKFPVVFGKEERRVYLEGEAYFVVSEDRDRPFVVCARNACVEVLGTEFNVNSYADNSEVCATLVDGSVKISSQSGGGGFRVLKPSEQGICDVVTGEVVSKKVNTGLYTSWKDGYYAFEQESLENIMHTLGRWYDMNVFFANRRVRNLKFSGRVRRYEDIVNFLDVMKLTDDVSFVVKGKTITVMD